MPKGEGMRQAARELRERREANGQGWTVLRDRAVRLRLQGRR